MTAYEDSKARAYYATSEWMVANKPSFDVVNVMPSLIVGRDDTATTPADAIRGSNGFVLGPLVSGKPLGFPVIGVSVHVENIAKMHVDGLNKTVPAGDYLAASHSHEDVQWSIVPAVVKKHFPEAVKEGIFKVDDPSIVMESIRNIPDSTKAQKAFGMTFRSREEQIVDILEHYLELLGKQ